MKLLTINHRDLTYEFRLLESVGVIQVTKANRFAYIMRRSVGLFSCNCPGAKYHRKCWHPTVVAQLLKQPRITEPWCQWAEEAALMQYGRMSYGKNK